MGNRQERREMAEAVAVAYEEQRQRQIEANKRKLEELELHRLSAAVREAAAAAKPSLAKKGKARVPRDGAACAEPLRRSGRLADLPEKPVYYEVMVRNPNPNPKRNARLPMDAAVRSDAISKAEELVQDLGSGFPIFIQPMIQSHVTRGFWLGLPTYFCLKHLPKRNEIITLVDEVDDESETLYLAKKADLSTGWKEFAIKHKLHDGDCLVFQLIEPTKFKVYIIRATSYFESEH